ncbi:MAG: AsmA family protein, partial [Bacteroidota bacterium]
MKFFKRLLLIIGFFIGLLLIALITITSLFQDQIGERVTHELNSQLKGELKIDGFELSFLRSFPNIGANLQGVSLDGTDNKPLLQAEELSFRAGLFSLLGSNIKLQSVVVRDGSLKIHISRNGKNNYDIFQETASDQPESSSSDGAIDLKEASIINMDVHYMDEQSKQNIRLLVEDANFAGQFASDNYELDSEAELMITYLSMDGEQLLSNQALSYQTKLDVNTTTATYGIEQWDIQLGQLPLNSSGQFQLLEDKMALAIKFQSDGGELEDLINLLPYQYKSNFEEIRTRGTFSLNGSINGDYSERSMPKITAALAFSDGRITGDRIDASVRDLGFSATYTNGDRQDAATSSLVLENLQGNIDGDPFALDLSVANFDDPKVDFSANGTLAPGLMMGFIPDERISEGTGKIYLNHLKVKGRYKDMLSVNRAERVDMSGQLSFEEAG